MKTQVRDPLQRHFRDYHLLAKNSINHNSDLKIYKPGKSHGDSDDDNKMQFRMKTIKAKKRITRLNNFIYPVCETNGYPKGLLYGISPLYVCKFMVEHGRHICRLLLNTLRLHTSVYMPVVTAFSCLSNLSQISVDPKLNLT